MVAGLMGLHLGPLLRHTGSDEATVWVQTTGPCLVEVRPEGVEAASERTFSVEGHHYALVHVKGLPTGESTPYEVFPVFPPPTTMLLECDPA